MTSRVVSTRPGSPSRPPGVVVVGAGISGVACARTLQDAGIAVRVLDRAQQAGGRMAVATVDTSAGPHPVDIGAQYLTADHPELCALLDRWAEEGLVRRWTDTFHLATVDGGRVRLTGSTTGPMRWAARDGLRSLVERLARGLDLRLGQEVRSVLVGSDGGVSVDGETALAAVLAMPDPQAADLLGPTLSARLDVRLHRDWDPAVAVYASWATPWWRAITSRPQAVFVNGHDVLQLVVDDGLRRGDDAPVLVALTTPAFAAGCLDDDAGVAVGPVLRALTELFGTAARMREVPRPAWARAHRWTAAAPRSQHRGAPFALAGGLVGVCGDAFGARSRVQAAYLSGVALGRELCTRAVGRLG